MSQALVTLGLHMDRVTLSVPAEPAFRGTVRLVVGGIGSGARLTFEQVNELQLAVESLLAHRRVAGDVVLVEADLAANTLSLALGPFLPEDDPAGSRVV